MKKSSSFKESGRRNFFRKYGYYMVLGVCVLCVGVAGWAAMKKISTPPTERIISTTAPNKNTGEQKAGVNVSGVEKETTTVASTTTQAATESQSTTKAPVTTTEHAKTTISSDALDAAAGKPFESYYMAPIGNGISKAYSNGELVYSETMNDWRVHNGTDFKAEKGDPVKAITDGIVLDVYEDSLMGVVVEVNHGNGVIAKYCGLAKNPPVKKDTMLTMGQTIGMIGDMPMESVEQYHLHLEVTIDKKQVDPASILKAN